ncbi:MAG: SUMF1/EgtB/PvdO family nonheme iron enzyme [Myxococcales bacterium]|nr:SUMF1/EgtB/PvdO family nonheme iron enzyme [Myxococcales bacterium]
MRRLGGALLIALLAQGCDDGGGEAAQSGDAGPVADAGEPFACNVAKRRAELADPPALLACDGAPETVTVGSLEVFKYEASHPLASADVAFPCADEREVDFAAPEVPTEPCSLAGVRPWHTVKWEDADAACKAIGWRLCSSAELVRTCGGEEGFTFAYGGTFQAGKCNVREAFRPEGAETASEAPTGYFTECESPSGAFDVNGNLWEWTNDRDEADSRARQYQGAGWRTIAQRHQDANQACGTETLLRGFSAPSFANRDVGFRCCRSAQ